MDLIEKGKRVWKHVKVKLQNMMNVRCYKPCWQSLQVPLLIIHAQLISDNVLLWEDNLTRGVFMSRFKVHLHLLYCPLNAFQLLYTSQCTSLLHQSSPFRLRNYRNLCISTTGILKLPQMGKDKNVYHLQECGPSSRNTV